MPVFIAEVAPATARGKMGALNQMAISIGVTLGFVAGSAFGGPARRCLCIVFPLPSRLRHCLCLVFPPPSQLRHCLSALCVPLLPLPLALCVPLPSWLRRRRCPAAPQAVDSFFGGWRRTAWAGVLPPTLLGLGLLAVPETPRWLVAHGRLDQGKASLTWLRGGRGGGKDTAFAFVLCVLSPAWPRQCLSLRSLRGVGRGGRGGVRRDQ